MSTSANTDTKEDTTNTEPPISDETKTDTKPNDSTTTPSPKKKKKKKKILYQETAVKYYDGFMKNKRYNKGVTLSTACDIFKTAWELPENNGLILPSRVIRHFKQVLPKKPKTNKKKTNNNNKKKNDKNNNNKNNSNDSNNISTNTSNTTTNNNNNDEEQDAFRVRSRTMMDMNVPKNIAELIAEDEKFKMDKEEEQRHIGHIVTFPANPLANKLPINTQKLEDKLEVMIEQKVTDEELLDAKEMKLQPAHAPKAKSFGNLMYDVIADDDELLKNAKNVGFTPKGDDKDPKLEDESPIISNAQSATTVLCIPDNNGNKENAANRVQIKSSDTPSTPDIFIDHADVTKDDLKPDVEEIPMLQHRAETDIKHMHHDLISFEDEILLKSNNVSTPKVTIEEMKEEKKEEPKKKKKKKLVLYSEDATKLFKKFNDGKRLKNGITLRKACKIFSVAWELPEENGRVLPSKVARHFKQVLPSKKTAKKNTKAKSGPGPVGGGKHNKRDSTNIKPSIVSKSRTHRDNVTVSIIHDEAEDDMIKPQSMRGNMMPYIGFYSSPNADNNIMRSSVHVVPRSSNALNVAKIGKMEPKKSIVTDLENLISADPNRSSSRNEHEVKHQKAASLTDLDLDVNGNDVHDDDEHVVENEVEQLIKEKLKKLKEKKEIDAKKEMDAKKQQEQDQDLMNAIDASLGL